jgi:biopolymer transport protein TolQ
VAGALLTTIAGLLVAIPSVFGYNYLFACTKRLITELENFASSLADRIELESK